MMPTFCINKWKNQDLVDAMMLWMKRDTRGEYHWNDRLTIHCEPHFGAGI